MLRHSRFGHGMYVFARIKSVLDTELQKCSVDEIRYCKRPVMTVTMVNALLHSDSATYGA